MTTADGRGTARIPLLASPPVDHPPPRIRIAAPVAAPAAPTPWAATLRFRACILALACSLTFGSYFAYDNPGALTAAFRYRICHNSTSRYEWMYSIYSWPNVVQPFFGGILIDNILGPRRAAIIFCALITVGTAVVATAAAVADGLPVHERTTSFLPFYIAVGGRFVFGLGGESLTVTQNTFIARWFSGRELATAFAITLSFSRIGSALNFAVEKPIANQFGFSWALWTSAGFCALSTLAGVLLARMDRLGEEAGVVGSKRKTKKEKKRKPTTAVSDAEEAKAPGATRSGGDQVAAAVRGGEEEQQAEEDADADADADEDEEEPNLRDVGKVLRCREVLMYGICMSFYVAVFVFITIASSFFQRKFEVTPSVANSYVAIPYTVSACLSPFLGFAIDRVGYSAQWVFLASCNLAAIHLCFSFTALSPFPAMLWMGVTYSLCAASLWPMVALIVEIKQLGTAYGLMTALQNLGLAVAPLIIGPLVDDNTLASYQLAELIFAGCGAVAAVFTLALCAADARLGEGLLYSSSGRIRKVQARRVKEKRRAARERARERERAATARMMGDEEAALSSLTTSWQSTVHSLSPPGPGGSRGGGPPGLFSPKTDLQLRNDYFRRLDILLRRKGGLS